MSEGTSSDNRVKRGVVTRARMALRVKEKIRRFTDEFRRIPYCRMSCARVTELLSTVELGRPVVARDDDIAVGRYAQSMSAASDPPNDLARGIHFRDAFRQSVMYPQVPLMIEEPPRFPDMRPLSEKVALGREDLDPPPCPVGDVHATLCIRFDAMR